MKVNSNPFSSHSSRTCVFMGSVKDKLSQGNYNSSYQTTLIHSRRQRHENLEFALAFLSSKSRVLSQPASAQEDSD